MAAVTMAVKARKFTAGRVRKASFSGERQDVEILDQLPSASWRWFGPQAQ